MGVPRKASTVLEASFENSGEDEVAGTIVIHVDRLEGMSLLLPQRAREDCFTLTASCGGVEDCTDSMGYDLSHDGGEPSSPLQCFLPWLHGATPSDNVVWNTGLSLTVSPADLAAALRTDGREKLEISVVGRRGGRLKRRARLLGSCTLPFLHLEESKRLFARLTPAADIAVSSSRAAGVWVSVRWQPSPTASTSALHGALLRSLGASMTTLHDEEISRYRAPLGVRSFATANERFMRCMIYVYRSQESLENIFHWQNPERSLMALGCWAAFCFAMHQLVALLPLGMVYLAFTLTPHAPTAPYTPLSRDRFTIAEKMEFMRLLQNFQVKFSDKADAVHKLVTHDLRQPHTLRLLRTTSAALAAVGLCASYFATLLQPYYERVPWQLCVFLCGGALLLAGNPRVRALLAFARVVLLVRYRSVLKKSHQHSREQILERWKLARRSIINLHRMSRRASVEYRDTRRLSRESTDSAPATPRISYAR